MQGHFSRIGGILCPFSSIILRSILHENGLRMSSREHSCIPDTSRLGWTMLKSTWVKIQPSEIPFFCQTRSKWKFLSTTILHMLGTKRMKPSSQRIPSLRWSMDEVASCCVSAKGPGNMVSVHGTIGKQVYIDILANNIVRVLQIWSWVTIGSSNKTMIQSIQSRL